MAQNEFIHRPISIIVDGVSEMETVRSLSASETRVLVNVRLDLASARALLRLLFFKVMADQPVDLVAFTLRGKLK